MSKPDVDKAPGEVEYQLKSFAARRRKNLTFLIVCLATAMLSVAILVALLLAIFAQGYEFLDWAFLRTPPSPTPEEAGIGPALGGTIWICLGCALFTLPLGVGTAIFIEEFRPKDVVLRRLHGFIQLNIANLAGVPSVVYGIIGLTAFAAMFGLFKSGGSSDPTYEIGVKYYDQFLTEGDRVILAPAASRDAEPTKLEPGMFALSGKDYRPVEVSVIGEDDPYPEDEKELEYAVFWDSEGGRIANKSWYYLSLPFGRGVLTGSLTLMLVVLPIVIIASQEAIRSVPNSLREGAYGMGATRWQTVARVTLPASIPGIMTGSILAMSRAIGEAAPILMIAGIVYITNSPRHLMDDFTVMPLQIYNWAGRPQVGFHHVAASGIIVLLAVLLCFNAVAVFIRYKLQKPLS